jgi:hypothetical protein
LLGHSKPDLGGFIIGTFCVAAILVCTWQIAILLGRGGTSRAALASAQVEKAPAQQRSLEAVDSIGGFGEPNVYLIRARSCYYLVVNANKNPVVKHLEDCPNPIHQSKK